MEPPNSVPWRSLAQAGVARAQKSKSPTPTKTVSGCSSRRPPTGNIQLDRQIAHGELSHKTVSAAVQFPLSGSVLGKRKRTPDVVACPDEPVDMAHCHRAFKRRVTYIDFGRAELRHEFASVEPKLDVPKSVLRKRIVKAASELSQPSSRSSSPAPRRIPSIPYDPRMRSAVHLRNKTPSSDSAVPKPTSCGPEDDVYVLVRAVWRVVKKQEKQLVSLGRQPTQAVSLQGAEIPTPTVSLTEAQSTTRDSCDTPQEGEGVTVSATAQVEGECFPLSNETFSSEARRANSPAPSEDKGIAVTIHEEHPSVLVSEENAEEQGVSDGEENHVERELGFMEDVSASQCPTAPLGTKAAEEYVGQQGEIVDGEEIAVARSVMFDTPFDASSQLLVTPLPGLVGVPIVEGCAVAGVQILNNEIPQQATHTYYPLEAPLEWNTEHMYAYHAPNDFYDLSYTTAHGQDQQQNFQALAPMQVIETASQFIVAPSVELPQSVLPDSQPVAHAIPALVQPAVGPPMSGQVVSQQEMPQSWHPLVSPAPVDLLQTATTDAGGQITGPRMEVDEEIVEYYDETMHEDTEAVWTQVDLQDFEEDDHCQRDFMEEAERFLEALTSGGSLRTPDEDDTMVESAAASRGDKDQRQELPAIPLLVPDAPVFEVLELPPLEVFIPDGLLSTNALSPLLPTLPLFDQDVLALDDQPISPLQPLPELLSSLSQVDACLAPGVGLSDSVHNDEAISGSASLSDLRAWDDTKPSYDLLDCLDMTPFSKLVQDVADLIGEDSGSPLPVAPSSPGAVPPSVLAGLREGSPVSPIERRGSSGPQRTKRSHRRHETSYTPYGIKAASGEPTMNVDVDEAISDRSRTHGNFSAIRERGAAEREAKERRREQRHKFKQLAKQENKNADPYRKTGIKLWLPPERKTLKVILPDDQVDKLVPAMKNSTIQTSPTHASESSSIQATPSHALESSSIATSPSHTSESSSILTNPAANRDDVDSLLSAFSNLETS